MTPWSSEPSYFVESQAILCAGLFPESDLTLWGFIIPVKGNWLWICSTSELDDSLLSLPLTTLYNLLILFALCNVQSFLVSLRSRNFYLSLFCLCKSMTFLNLGMPSGLGGSFPLSLNFNLVSLRFRKLLAVFWLNRWSLTILQSLLHLSKFTLLHLSKFGLFAFKQVEDVVLAPLPEYI